MKSKRDKNEEEKTTDEEKSVENIKETGLKLSSGLTSATGGASPNIYGGSMHVDLSSLPVKYVDRLPLFSIVLKIFIGLLISFVGGMLAIIPSVMEKSESFEGLNEGASAASSGGFSLFASVLILVGAVIVCYFCFEIFKSITIKINRESVHFIDKNVREIRRNFLEPLENYKGLQSRTRVAEHGGYVFKQLIIEMIHKKDEEKNVPLFVDNEANADEQTIKEMAEQIGLEVIK
jgi:hypothetical protein